MKTQADVNGDKDVAETPQSFNSLTKNNLSDMLIHIREQVSDGEAVLALPR